MKKTFTILIAAIAAILMMAQPKTAMGQKTDPTAVFDFDTNAGTDFGITGTSSNNSTAGDITEDVSATINGVTVTITPVSSGTNNRFWNSSPKLRLYGGTMTISVNNAYTIESIAFSQGKWNASNSFNSGSFESDTWTGSASSVVLTIAGNTQIKTMTVTYKSASGGGGGSYTVTVANNIIGGSVVANPTSGAQGASITLTATPTANSGYYFNNDASNWSVTYGNNQTCDVTPGENNTATFSMPASNVTARATFTPYTVTLNAGNGTVGGNTTTTWNVTQNNGNLPSATSPNDEWSFGGWSTSPVATETTVAPTFVATAYKPTSNNTLYAVYTKTEVGSAFDGATGGDYLIYANTGGNNPNHYAKGPVSSSALTGTTSTSDATTFSFTKTSNNNVTPVTFTIKIKGETNYIGGASGGGITSQQDAHTWTVSGGTKGTWRLTSETDTRGFIFRVSSDVFKNYATSNVTANGTDYYDLEIVSALTHYHSTPAQTVETPYFDPAGGSFEAAQSVQIKCNTDDVTIYYTLNGDEPTNTSSSTNFQYNSALNIESTTTIKAKAYKTDWNPSAVASATYTIQHDVEEPFMEDATFDADGYEVIIVVPDNTTVRYTTNGTDPDSNSDVYDENNPFTINTTTTVKAIAYDGDGCASDVVSATYTRVYSLAAAKALYTNADVPNITINLIGVQFIAKSGSNTYVQQGEVGLLIYGSNNNNWTNGSVFTAGTITGTISKYGQNLQIKNFTFAGVEMEAGTLAASATGVTIPNITGSFSTYEDRFVSLTSLTLSVSGKTLTDTDSHTLAIYDPFSVLSEAVQPNDNDNVVVTGIVTSYYKDSNTTYQIIPLTKSGISTGIAATLPSLDPVGGVTEDEAVETETVTVTPAAGTTVTYAFGEDYDEIDSETELTVPSTNATALELVVNRDFYTENTATYYYKTSATTYDVTFYVNGDEDTSLAKEVVEGGTLGALPTPTTPSGYTFRGWAQAEISGVQNNAPTMVSSTTTVNADMDLYAVFAIQTNIEETIELTNSAITNYKSNSTTSYSNDYSINNWTGRYLVNNSNNTYYLQLGYNANSGKTAYNSHLTTPECAYNITSITINTNNNTASGRTFYLCSASNLGTASSTNATYGYGSTSSANGSVTITINGNTKQFHIYPDGIACIASVTLVCSAVTYSNYCTSVSEGNTAINVVEGSITNNELTGVGTVAANTAVSITNLTIKSGAKLIVEGALATASPDNLIIKDGGQLVLNSTNKGVQATFEKDITSSAKDAEGNWYTISTPTGGINITSVTNLVDNEGHTLQYNLFRYDEPSHMWEAYNPTTGNHEDFTTLEKGRGYLYRNNGKPLSFAGEVNVGDVTGITLKRQATVNKMKGFNLIGNPFGHNIYKGEGASIDNTDLADGFYYLNNNGGWQAGIFSTPIAPQMGILVQVSNTEITSTSLTIKDNTVVPTEESKYANDNLMFTVSNNDYEDVTYAMFHKGYGLNKINHRNADIPMLYINHDNDDYAIAMLNDDTKAFNLNFEAKTTGKYTLSYKAEGEFTYLHVIDRLTGIDVDMLLDGEYSFIATPNDNKNRFIVSLGYLPDYGEGNNDIFAFQNGNGILVSGEGELQIFDVTGRSVMITTINGAESINLSARGVYILRLVGAEVKTQKIVVK